jgi:hypothetical protein
MAEKTLTEALGTNAVQDATTITLSKADLGLTGATNTADQVITAIAIKAKPSLTQAKFDSEANQNVYITDGFASYTTKNNENYSVKQIVINMAKLDNSTPNPMDY